MIAACKQRRDFRAAPGRRIDLPQAKKEVWCWPNLSSQTIVWTCEQTSSFESGQDSSTDLAQTQKKEVWCGAKPLAADRCAKGETMAELAAVYGVDQATIW